MKTLGLARNSLLALGLLGFGLVGLTTGCNTGLETVAVQTSALVGQPFFLDVSTHQAWVNTERTLETADAKSEHGLGCNAILLDGPLSATLSGMTIEWTPSSGDEGIASFLVEFSSGCGDVSNEAVNYEVPVKADPSNASGSTQTGSGTNIHDLDPDDDYTGAAGEIP